jgi:hypothetical protein
MTPAKSGTSKQAPSRRPAKVTGPALPATVKYGIDWTSITPQVVRHVRRRLKAKPRLPHGWDEKKVVSHLCLKVAGLLIQQKGEQAAKVSELVKTQADLLFTTFPATCEQEDRCDTPRMRVTRGKKHIQRREGR